MLKVHSRTLINQPIHLVWFQNTELLEAAHKRTILGSSKFPYRKKMSLNCPKCRDLAIWMKVSHLDWHAKMFRARYSHTALLAQVEWVNRLERVWGHHMRSARSVYKQGRATCIEWLGSALPTASQWNAYIPQNRETVKNRTIKVNMQCQTSHVMSTIPYEISKWLQSQITPMHWSCDRQNQDETPVCGFSIPHSHKHDKSVPSAMHERPMISQDMIWWQTSDQSSLWHSMLQCLLEGDIPWHTGQSVIHGTVSITMNDDVPIQDTWIHPHKW